MKDKDYIKLQEITDEGGYVQGIYMDKKTAQSFSSTLKMNIEKLKNSTFADTLNQDKVKLYFEALENKLEQAERIANFFIKKK